MNIKEVSDAELAFGGRDMKELIPYSEEGYKEYRAKYWRDDSTWGWKLFHDWFYHGLTELNLIPKLGIDKEKALRHIRAIMVSWAPKHEDKTAACAYLFEQWFESANWKAGDK